MGPTKITDARVLHSALLQEGWVVRGGLLLRDIPERPIFLRVLEARMDGTTAVIVIPDPFSPDGKKRFVIPDVHAFGRRGPRDQWVNLTLESEGTQLVLDKPPLQSMLDLSDERGLAERIEESEPDSGDQTPTEFYLNHHRLPRGMRAAQGSNYIEIDLGDGTDPLRFSFYVNSQGQVEVKIDEQRHSGEAT